MYNYNKAQQSKNRVHNSWDILYIQGIASVVITYLKFNSTVNSQSSRLKFQQGCVIVDRTVLNITLMSVLII